MMPTPPEVCDVCNKQFKSKKNLGKHEKLHKLVKRIYCDYCGAVFGTKTEISSHIDIHRKFTILQCKVCNSKVTTTKILKDHLKGHLFPKTCEYCGKSFPRIVELSLHIEAKHVNDQKFSCLFCPRKFSTKKMQREHESRIHRRRKKEAFVCTECHQSFTMREDLRLHSFEHFTDKVFTCSSDSCGKFFKSQSALSLHNKSHSQEKQYRCLRCDKSFVQSSGLSKHRKSCNKVVIKKTEEIDPEEIILVAKAQYQELLSIKGRKRRNDNLKEKLPDSDEAEDFWGDSQDAISDGDSRFDRSELDDSMASSEAQQIELSSFDIKQIPTKAIAFTCDLCSSEFHSKQKILAHFKSQHYSDFDRSPAKVTNNLVLCRVCPRSFSSQAQCTQHEKYSHEQQPIECGICGKKLKNPVCLRAHMNNYHDPSFKRPKLTEIDCPRCPKMFEGKTKLQRHLMNVHDKTFNGKEYPCNQCQAAFTRKSDLREHSFIHITDKEIFSCLICGQQFFNQAKLKFHSFTHNPQQVQCEICSRVYARRAALRKHLIMNHVVRSDIS